MLTETEKEIIPKAQTPEEALTFTYKYLNEIDPEYVRICKEKAALMRASGMHPAQIAYGTINATFETIQEVTKPIKEERLNAAGINPSRDMSDDDIDKMVTIEGDVDSEYFWFHLHEFRFVAKQMLYDACKQWVKDHEKDASKLGFGNNIEEIYSLFDKIGSHPNLWDKFTALCMKFDFQV